MEDGNCHLGAAETMITTLSSPVVFPALLCILMLSLGLLCLVASISLSFFEKPNSRCFLLFGTIIILWSTCIGEYSQIRPADISNLFKVIQSDDTS